MQAAAAKPLEEGLANNPLDEMYQVLLKQKMKLSGSLLRHVFFTFNFISLIL